MWEFIEWVYGVGWLTAWVLLAYAVAVMAEDRGKPPLLWFVLGLVLPLLSLLVIAFWSRSDQPAIPSAPWPPERSDEDLGFGGAAATGD